MTDPIRIDARELTSGEVLDLLKSGQRVVVEVSIVGISLDMSIRKQAETYYCDTPMKLLTYDTDEGMRNCLERYRLARAEGTEGD